MVPLRVGDGVREVDRRTCWAAPGRCRACSTPEAGGSSKYDCDAADGRRAVGAVAVLQRHAGDVHRRVLDGEVDDEVFGALAGDRGVVEELPAASVRPGYWSSWVWATNSYWPAGRPEVKVRLM